MGPRNVELKNLLLFKYAEAGSLAALGDAAKFVTKARGDAILLKDEPVFGIYVVLNGKAGVLESNIPAPVAVFNPNDTIGERAALHDLKSSVSVRALSDQCELALIPRKVIIEHMTSNPSFAASIYHGLSEVLATRLSASNDRFRKLVANKQPGMTPFSSIKDIGEIETERQAQHKINASLISGVIMALEQVADSLSEEARCIVMSCAKDLATARENEAKGLMIDDVS